MKERATFLFATGLLIAGTGCGTIAQPGITIRELRCEYRVNPLGVETSQPRLSWIMDSAQRNQKQSAYQILVASSTEELDANTGDRWDSGIIESDRSVQVVYAGQALASHMPCYWKVRVWDKDGHRSPWSRPAFWSMGMLNESDWTGQWIGLDKEADKAAEPNDGLATHLNQARWIWFPDTTPGVDAPPGRRFFRRNITLPENRGIIKATFAVTSDNNGKAFVNGRRLGDLSNFNAVYAFDITRDLVPGRNTLAVTAENAGTDNNPAGVLGVLYVEFDQGDPLAIVTDAQWKAADTPASNWQRIQFDDARWVPAEALVAYGEKPWGTPALSKSEERRLPARMLRREFRVENQVKRAVAALCGLGYYELYLNGQKIGDHVLDPGLTDYTKRVLYASYDVTDQLNHGDNAVGVLLGNGRFYAPRLNIPTKTITYGYPKMLIQLRIEYADGRVQNVVSDDQWKLTTHGPIRANNDYDGEVYDARMEMPGWCKAGFDDSNWHKAEIVEAPGGILVSQMAEPIRITQTLEPIAMTEPRPGLYVYDMGQNMVGWIRLKVRGPEGTTVSMRFSEVLKDDGTLYLDNMRSCKVTDTYTLKGADLEVYEPRFTYHGFRFVELSGLPGRPDLNTITGCVARSSGERAGEFSCSHELVNRIYRNIVWGMQGNMRSVPTDCPQRDERQGWLGDIANAAQSESYTFNMASFYTKWLNDIEDAQKEDGNVPDVAPAFWPFYTANVTWPSAYLIIPSWYQQQYDDTRILMDHYDSMNKWIEFMSQFIQDDIMVRDQYGDWCVPPESPELIHTRDPARKTSKEVLGSTYFYHDLKLMARYAKMLDKQDDARRFNARADQLKQAFNRKFFNANTATYDNGTQTSSVLPLAFGMVPEGHESAVFQQLVDNILDKTDGHIATGLIGGQWLMRVLSDHGRPDVAWKLATNKTYPSWGYMAEHGATTVWELWNGDTANPAMNSHNHLMLVGDLCIWFYEYLAGIRSDPRQPGFKHIILHPVPVVDLKSVKAHYDSIHGRISSDWTIENRVLHWTIAVPVNTSATIHVPTTDANGIRESGRPANEVEGMAFVREENGAAVFEVGSGTYAITSPYNRP